MIRSASEDGVDGGVANKAARCGASPPRSPPHSQGGEGESHHEIVDGVAPPERGLEKVRIGFRWIDGPLGGRHRAAAALRCAGDLSEGEAMTNPVTAPGLAPRCWQARETSGPDWPPPCGGHSTIRTAAPWSAARSSGRTLLRAGPRRGQLKDEGRRFRSRASCGCAPATHRGGSAGRPAGVGPPGGGLGTCRAATAAGELLTPNHHRTLRRTSRLSLPRGAAVVPRRCRRTGVAGVRTAAVGGRGVRCSEAGWDDTARIVVDALWPLFHQIGAQRFWMEAHETGLAAARRAGDPRGVSRMLDTAAVACSTRGATTRRSDWFGQALQEALRDSN